MTFDEWIKIGFTNGWCGNTHCYTHSGAPMSQAEREALDEGDDHCITMLRLYDGPEQRNLVEHEPFFQ